ncbi:MAG: DUF2975 domain-containing protein [Ruminococcaceae bacterium]|nr:DUF2975 domain-containing protein [Oscillospiraceae bacterium]
MKRNIIKLIKPGMLAVILICALLCILWIPRAATYLTECLFVPEAVIYTLFVIAALPIFVILAIGFSFVKDIEKDTVFSIEVSRRVRLVSVLLFCDCLVVFMAAAVLIALGEYILAPALGFIGLMGFLVDCALFILSDYIKRAAILKEESEATL